MYTLNSICILLYKDNKGEVGGHSMIKSFPQILEEWNEGTEDTTMKMMIGNYQSEQEVLLKVEKIYVILLL